MTAEFIRPHHQLKNFPSNIWDLYVPCILLLSCKCNKTHSYISDINQSLFALNKNTNFDGYTLQFKSTIQRNSQVCSKSCQEVERA